MLKTFSSSFIRRSDIYFHDSYSNNEENRQRYQKINAEDIKDKDNQIREFQ